MVQRAFWLRQLEAAWRHRSLIWLMGVRRVGKTFLCKSLQGAEYLDCELPSVRRALEDPEAFLRERRGTIILDEIHRLPNPSEVLKIAADHFPSLRLLATGSSSLSASSKFKDTLAGRKTEILLTPMNQADLVSFASGGLLHRLRNGGLPPLFLAHEFPEHEYQEWLDSYWAKDIQELFRLERRSSFLRFAELLFLQSGGLFEASAFAKPCEVSRTTIQNYLAVLEATFVAVVVRPYHTNRATEVVAAPKVYGFDTGFVCAFRGWKELRVEDCGSLWEHYVLNELRSQFPRMAIRYWRDKQKHELDFVIPLDRTRPPSVVECKWSAETFDPAALKVFRRHYPGGANFVVAHNVSAEYSRRYGDLLVQFVDLPGLASRLAGRCLDPGGVPRSPAENPPETQP